LEKRDVKPDLILPSSANRALKTADIIAKKLDYRRKDIVVENRLYAADADNLLDVMHKLGDKLNHLILFRHNPELTDLVHRLSREITRMPTCYAAQFSFDVKPWSHIGKVTRSEVVVNYPKKS
jgi:phosphohistidine phosphatase